MTVEKAIEKMYDFYPNAFEDDNNTFYVQSNNDFHTTEIEARSEEDLKKKIKNNNIVDVFSIEPCETGSRDIDWGVTWDITINGYEATWEDLTELEQENILNCISGGGYGGMW